MIVGNFNKIVSLDEKLGGGSRSQTQMNSFRNVLDFCDLRRLSYIGYKYTWDNRREGAENTKLMLDRRYLNSAGHSNFPYARIKHIANFVSDHLCLLVALKGFGEQVKNASSKRFHFELAWTKEEECEKVIRESWGAMEGDTFLVDI